VSRTGIRTLAALLVGAALGAATAAGNALLLYTGHGFLRAAGLLVASTILAVAAGVWAGAPEADDVLAPVRSRSRWVTLIMALVVGGAFAALWGTSEPLQNLALGGAFAVLLVVALPAYAAGALLATLHARERQDLPAYDAGSVAAAATAGAAFGVLISTSVLIQNLEPYGIYYGAAGLLTLMAMMEWSSTGQPHTRTADMRDHVAIITGAGKAGQLGFAIARRFLSAGASVVVTGLGDDIEAVAAELGSGERVAAVRADLTDEAQVLAVLQTARDRFGRLDSVINTAGGLTLIKPVAETSAVEWEREIRRNAGTALLMSRAALPLLRETRGAIVNFASPAGARAVANMGAYSAGKAAVIALTRALALEEKAHGVRVNAIAPGMMDTGQNVQSAADDAEFVNRDDVASVALFLAGPDSHGITGETIHVTATAHR
jgi:NAD(P)-dependent dehydrogenase (short-subunit alcohol dehydrogenase family)